MNFLIDERPLIVLPSLVSKLGSLGRAVVLQQIHWLLHHNEGRVDENGVRWVWGTYAEWCEKYFPFWSERQLRRYISWLEREGYLLSTKPEAENWDHTKHYTINYERLQEEPPAPEPPAPEPPKLPPVGEFTAAYTRIWGMLVPSAYVAEKIAEWSERVPLQVWEHALQAAMDNNVRKWSYLESILRRIEEEGMPTAKAEQAVLDFSIPEDYL